MIRDLFIRHAKAKREAAAAKHQHDRAEARWDEVRELSTWARETRERNHLTDLFLRSLGGQP